MIRHGYDSALPRENTRHTVGILSDETRFTDDADVIMTATVLGFALLRLREDQPVRFDTEGSFPAMQPRERAEAAEAAQAMTDTVVRLNRVLQATNPTLPRWVEQGTSPTYDSYNKAVYGVPSNEQDEFFQRRVEPEFRGVAAELHREVRSDPTLAYQGRGAYTGMVVSPEGAPSILGTFGTIVPDAAAFGERWRPIGVDNLGVGRLQRTWGMIGTNRTQKELMGEQMRFVPPAFNDAIRDWDPQAEPYHPWTATAPHEDLVGYTHGMVSAIVKCRIRGHGARPYEIATGRYTTKLASCFPCTLFMHANDFPPSSTHLDKGESWVPMYPTQFDAAVHGTPPEHALLETNQRFYDFCTACLRLGAATLHSEAGHPYVDAHHRSSLDALMSFLAQHVRETTCANLILDALTVSDRERTRIDRTLKFAP